MRLSKLQNIFVQITKYICLNVLPRDLNYTTFRRRKKLAKKKSKKAKGREAGAVRRKWLSVVCFPSPPATHRPAD